MKFNILHIAISITLCNNIIVAKQGGSMKFNNVYQIYFSPGGMTKKITEQCASVISGNIKTIDLLKDMPKTKQHFEPDDIVVIGMPVFSGRLPSVAPGLLSLLKGDNTPAIIIADYGNREYEDALLELYDHMQANGFIVIGGGAFIARHSIFPSVAGSRPDAEDINLIKQFGLKCIEKLDKKEIASLLSPIKGNRPYRDTNALPLKITGSEKCNRCGICVNICPVEAIPGKNPRKTDKNKCILCTACIYACPQKARYFSGFKYNIGYKIFKKKFSARKNPEIFL